MNIKKQQDKVLCLNYRSLLLIGILGFLTFIAVCSVASDSVLIDVASGKPYSVDATPSASYPDTGGIEITDGIYGSLSNPFDEAWSGYDYDQQADFVIDLGANYNISSIYASFLPGFESWAIYLPSNVTAECSYDNISYNFLGILREDGNTGDFKITGLSQECRYVRVNTTHIGWMFIDEIDVLESLEDNISPLWKNQVTNTTTNVINQGEPIVLAAQVYDETGLDWAWLETNETGVWENKTGEIRDKDSLIPNQDFENVAYYGDAFSDMYGYRPFPWGFETFLGSPIFLVDNTTSHSGNVSMRMIGSSDNDAGVVAIPDSKDKIRVIPGFMYRQCAWIKYNITGNYGIRFMHQFFKAPCYTKDIIKTEYSTFYKGNSDWTFVCFDSTAPADAVCGDAVLELWGNGSVWVDDFRYWSLNDSSPVDMKNIQNSWVWVNFTWQNSSIIPTSVISWRIYVNDSAGNTNVTDIMSFVIGSPQSITTTSTTTTSTTTTTIPPVRTMHVGNIQMSISKSAGNCKASATVRILDYSDAGVASATVKGNWSGAFKKSVSSVTNAFGDVTFTTNWVRCRTFTFCVSNVVKSGWQYDPSANTETCDSIA